MFLESKREAMSRLVEFGTSQDTHFAYLVGEPETGKTLLARSAFSAPLYVDAQEAASDAVLLRRLSPAFARPLTCLFDTHTTPLARHNTATTTTTIIIIDHYESVMQLEDGQKTLGILSRLSEKHMCKVLFVGRRCALSLLTPPHPLIITVPPLTSDDLFCIAKHAFEQQDCDDMMRLAHSVAAASGPVLPEGFCLQLAQLLPLYARCAGTDAVQRFREMKPRLVELAQAGTLLAEPLELELSAVEKCMLIAAHLGRMNSAKQEMMVFGEEHGRSKRYATNYHSTYKNKTGNKKAMNSTIRANRAIQIHRVLAVFYHIYPHTPAPVLFQVLSCLRRLAELKLLLIVCQYERTDSFKVRCNLPPCKIAQMGTSIGIDVARYCL